MKPPTISHLLFPRRMERYSDQGRTRPSLSPVAVAVVEAVARPRLARAGMLLPALHDCADEIRVACFVSLSDDMETHAQDFEGVRVDRCGGGALRRIPGISVIERKGKKAQIDNKRPTEIIYVSTSSSVSTV